MKKIVGILSAAAVLATSVFAADIAAKTYLTGSLAGSDGDNVYLWKLNSQDQKDDDALKFSIGGEQAGASFQFWYKYGEADDDTSKGVVNFRSTSIWIKPIDMLKITVGDVSFSTYTEMVHWWKDPAGGSYVQSVQNWDGRATNYATVEGQGISLELTPIDGLLISAGMTAGVDTDGITFYKDGSTPYIQKWGAAVKYDFSGVAGIPLTAAISWRDDGSMKDWGYRGWKLLAVGVDYGNNWSDGFYGFLNARMRFDTTNAAYTEWTGADAKYSLRGITFDNYLKYSTGAFKIIGRFPVTVRLSGEDGDDSWMHYEVKASYALDGFTPYIDIADDLIDTGKGLNFGNVGDSFNMDIQCGVTFNVGSCSLDIAALVQIGDGADHDISWSVPFTMGVAF